MTRNGIAGLRIKEKKTNHLIPNQVELGREVRVSVHVSEAKAIFMQVKLKLSTQKFKTDLKHCFDSVTETNGPKQSKSFEATVKVHTSAFSNQESVE